MDTFGDEKDRVQVKYDPKGKRDPFISLLRKKEDIGISGLKGVQSIEDIVLEGIVVDRSRGSFVVANGVVLAEGETQEGIKVVEIRSDGVSFEIRGRKQFKPFEVSPAL